MSTISTHLNWGSSYISIDFYKRFLKPDASEKRLVAVGRITTVLLMVFSALLALLLSSALSTFSILLQIGAGTGLIFILRWFWWRINAFSEITGMIVSFIMAIFFEVTNFGLEDHQKLVIGVLVTTVSWIAVTLLSRPTDIDTLATFYNQVTPYGTGWKPFKKIAKSRGITLKTTTDNFTTDLASMLLGIVAVYAALFATGYFIYGNIMSGTILTLIAIIAAYFIFKFWKK
jgi:Na+/proline symporter